jgi:PDZ domain-containing secreted protein
LIQARKPGEKVDLAVTRGSQTLTVSVELGASSQDSSKAYLGIRYTPMIPGGQFRSPSS